MSNHEEKSANVEEMKLDETPVNADQILKTTVDREAVVSFIEGMVQAMGTAAINSAGVGGPAPKQHQHETERRFQSKNVAGILHKVERANKYPDVAKQLPEDATILEWLDKPGCKQKEYYDEFECAEALTSFFASRRHFELAVKSALKALNITKLHRRDDDETLSELYWVLADLSAAMDSMPTAIDYMKQCLAILEPGAGEDSATYKELAGQLKETRERSLGLVSA